MTIEMKSLIESNYETLYNNYCKYKNKNVITSSYTCEDIFNQKILNFIETDIHQPTLDMLKLFLKTKKNKISTFKVIEYKDCYINDGIEVDIMEDKLKMLFIDYRKK
jgi:hypothetical protein